MVGTGPRLTYGRSINRVVAQTEREQSNQQELLEEVEPHRRPGGRFVGALRVVLDDELYVAHAGHDRGKIEWRVRHLSVDLRLLHRKIVARAMAMIFARAVRVAIVLVARVIGVAFRRLFESRIFTATINVRVVPAATDRGVNQQRRGNQTG
jgi:hypothetical protein